MKITLAGLILTLSTGYAFAGGGTPGSSTSGGASPSDRPAAARLDAVRCQAVWKLTEREGDVLLANKADPYVVNFEMVDTNKDGKISEAEFTEGCNGGWVVEPEKSEKMHPEATKP